MYTLVVSGRNKVTVALLVVISVSVLVLTSWHFGTLDDIDLHSQAEAASGYVKQWFNKPENVTEAVAPKVIAPDAVRIYIGIVTAWWKFGERMILRETYQHFNISSNDTCTIRFVLGLPPKKDVGVLQFLNWEQDRYKDLHIINMHENMNDGKTYEYFAELATWYPTQEPLERPWDFAMKADDDTLLILPNLLTRMRHLPRNDLYMGRGPGDWHMGAGYTLSWDLVLWLKENPMLEFRKWDEDQMIGAMLRKGQKGKNFVDLGDKVIDEPTSEGGWRRDYGDDVILVHRLKNIHLFGTAIDFFWRKDKKMNSGEPKKEVKVENGTKTEKIN